MQTRKSSQLKIRSQNTTTWPKQWNIKRDSRTLDITSLEENNTKFHETSLIGNNSVHYIYKIFHVKLILIELYFRKDVYAHYISKK